MKSMIFGAALLAAAFPALAQNVSVSVGQPGFYGRIDIGGYGPPPVVYAQPIIVQPQPRYAVAPVYLRVPEGHRRHWSRWCGRYGACGQRVFFVRDDWYANTYAPRMREQHGYHDRGPREYREFREPHGRDGWEHGRGHGNDHGNGHGNGHGRGHGRAD
jgi:hypothetical protein